MTPTSTRLTGITTHPVKDAGPRQWHQGHFKLPTDHPVGGRPQLLVVQHQTEVSPVARAARAAIRTITVRRWLAPSSFTRWSVGGPCGQLSRAGNKAAARDQRAYHVPRQPQDRVGSALTPVVERPRQRKM